MKTKNVFAIIVGFSFGLIASTAFASTNGQVDAKPASSISANVAANQPTLENSDDSDNGPIRYTAEDLAFLKIADHELTKYVVREQSQGRLLNWPKQDASPELLKEIADEDAQNTSDKPSSSIAKASTASASNGGV